MVKQGMKELETVIGLEVHLQFNTETKIFCSCANLFGHQPNTLTCPVCLGLPGTLPVLNKKALQYAIKVALALNCKINSYTKFDRKNYYYPDLPKGYQISQYDLPIGEYGFITLVGDTQLKKICIRRAHLEEDAGKLIHDKESCSSLIDYNRTGTPLMEIVSEPELSSPQEAYDYLTALKLTLQYLNVSDCDMEKGSLRCDANISIREKGDTHLGVKAEIKNMNSFKAVKTALEFEGDRQGKMILSNQPIIQETRLWDEKKSVTISMRNKEQAHDYRYFPEPDLLPFVISEEMISSTHESLPELPFDKFERFRNDYQLSEYDAKIIIQNQDLASFFENCAKLYTETKRVCNWIIGPLLQELNERKATVHDIKLKPDDLILLIKKVDEGILSNLSAKDTLHQVINTGKGVEQIIKEKGLVQVSDTDTLEKIVEEVIAENEKVVEQIKSGKETAVGFLVGQAMKKSKGKANPKKIGKIIKRRILND